MGTQNIEDENLKNFFNQAPMPMVILEGPEYRFTLANPEYEKFLGRKAQGKTLLEVFSQEEVAVYLPLLEGVYKTGIPFIGKELPLNLVDGRGHMDRRWIDIGYYPFRNTEGKIKGLFAIVQDATHQVRARHEQLKINEQLKRAAKELSVEKTKLSALVEKSSSAIGLMRGPDLVFEIANQKWTELVSEREYLGRKYTDIYPELIGTPAHKSLVDIYETGVPFVAEEMKLKVLSRNGIFEDQYFDYINVRIMDADGQPYGVFCNALNVTDRVNARIELQKAKWEAERANETKSYFLANMSHEIRTPLGAIVGFTELLKSAQLTPEEREYLEVIDRSGRALNGIIDDILDLSKVEAGQLAIEQIAFPVHDIVHEAFLLFSDKARSKQIDLKFETSLLSSKWVISDPARIRQILVNLIGNAVKFTEKGHVTVSLSAQPSGEKKSLVQVAVHDTGIGLSAEQIHILFQPFVQADNSTTRKFGGTGLGLALSKKLAQALGGNIRIENCVLGKGCTFIFEFETEIFEKTRSPKADILKTPGEPRRRLEKRHILLVDDSPDNRMLMGLYLAREGATVDDADCGSAAVTKALQNNYDLVLMDIQMPVMDGYTALMKLREQQYTKPVVALTAHAMLEERRRTKAAGFVDHVTKPVSQDDLVAVILANI